LQPRTEDIRAQYEDGGDKKSACRGSFLWMRPASWGEKSVEPFLVHN
jgi:hypothetical protein